MAFPIAQIDQTYKLGIPKLTSADGGLFYGLSLALPRSWAYPARRGPKIAFTQGEAAQAKRLSRCLRRKR